MAGGDNRAISVLSMTLLGLAVMLALYAMVALFRDVTGDEGMNKQVPLPGGRGWVLEETIGLRSEGKEGLRFSNQGKNWQEHSVRMLDEQGQNRVQRLDAQGQWWSLPKAEKSD